MTTSNATDTAAINVAAAVAEFRQAHQLGYAWLVQQAQQGQWEKLGVDAPAWGRIDRGAGGPASKLFRSPSGLVVACRCGESPVVSRDHHPSAWARGVESEGWRRPA